MTYIAEGQMSLFDQDTWFGRTYQEHSVPTVERTSAPSLKKLRGWSPKMPLFLDLRNGRTQDASWEMDGALLGVPMTRNFGESPNVAVESRLSQILEDTPHPKYCLSAKACSGILNRSERKGKRLPEILRSALLQQIADEGGQQSELLIDRTYCIGNGQAHDAHAPEVEVAKTLNCMVDPMKVVAYGLDRASFNQGQNAKFGFSVEEEVAPTVVSRGPGGGTDTIGALCARDYKGVGNQYVNEGKVIVTDYTGESSER